MGTFTNQVQGLVTEEKQKRLEREQTKQEKERREKQEIELFFTLDNIIYNSNNESKNEIFKELTTPDKRETIIFSIIKNGNEKDIYILTKKYNRILQNVYNAYKLNDKDIMQQEKEQAKAIERIQKQEEQKQKEQQQTKTNKKQFAAITIIGLILGIVKILCYIFLFPLVFLASFFIHKK